MIIQDPQLEQLAESVECQPRGVMLDCYLPNLPNEAVWALASWSCYIEPEAPAFAEWLHKLAVDEIYRRAEKRAVEVQMPRLPVVWTNEQLGQALLMSWRLAAANPYKTLDEFFKKLNMNLAVLVADRLKNESEPAQ